MPVWFIFSYFSIYFVLKFALISYSSTNSTSSSHPQQPPCPRRTGLSWEQGSPLLLWHLSSILDSTSFLTQTLHLFTKVPSFLNNWNVSGLTLESLDYQHHLPPHQLLSSHLLDLFSFPRHTHVHRFLFPFKWLWGCCCLFWCLTSNTWIWRRRKNAKNWHTRCARRTRRTWGWLSKKIPIDKPNEETEETLKKLWGNSEKTLRKLWGNSEETLKKLWRNS